MITEDYVNYETAKLLKEKGFEVPSFNYEDWLFCMYDEDGKINYGCFSEDWYPRITLQMAMKWLREVHNLHCDIGYDDLDWFWNIIYVGKEVQAEDRPKLIKDGLAGNKSYEETCEEAIKYCLENLI